MFIYDKKLQYPVKIANPNPRLAGIIISQYGGPDGELGASLRYLSQRYIENYLYQYLGLHSTDNTPVPILKEIIAKRKY